MVKCVLGQKAAWCFLWTNGQTNIITGSKKQSLTTWLGHKSRRVWTDLQWKVGYRHFRNIRQMANGLDRPFQGSVRSQNKNFPVIIKKVLKQRGETTQPNSTTAGSWQNVTNNFTLCNNKWNSAAYPQSTYRSPKDGPQKELLSSRQKAQAAPTLGHKIPHFLCKMGGNKRKKNFLADWIHPIVLFLFP